jgi:hypothetical protein
MEIKEITTQEFKSKQLKGCNQRLLDESQTGEYFSIQLESARKARNKVGGLYSARRKMSAQARIVLRDTKVVVGPGEYTPRSRTK